MNSKEIVSSSTYYDDKNLVLEYDRGDVMLYDLPAGSKEEAEEPLSGMLREFNEETGLSILDIRNVSALRPYSYDMDDTCFEVYPFDIELMDQRSPKELDSNEHTGYSWMNPTDLEHVGMNGWLSAPKFFNLKYIEVARNGIGDHSKGINDPEEIHFSDDEVTENLDDLESLIKSELNQVSR